MVVFRVHVPAMYGDHHVVEVRKLLLALDGVEKVYASSSLQMVEVQVDPAKTGEKEILAVLEQAGYLQEVNIPMETGEPQYGRTLGSNGFFRHTLAFEQVKNVIGFRQDTGVQGRALWPCPGMGVIRKKEVMGNE